jgi:hypothetical protein
MKADNPFDKKLEFYKNYAPRSLVSSAVYITDTLDLAWASAQAVFDDQAKPEHAIKILELFLAHNDSQKMEDEAQV